MLMDAIPLWVIFGLLFFLFCISLEGGFRWGRYRRLNAGDDREQSVGTIVASILGLLALVMGFTFNLAATRFDLRRQMMLKEANAIGTAFLRTSFLPEPQQSALRDQFRTYVAERLRGVKIEQFREAVKESEKLQAVIWSETVTAVSATPDSVLKGLFVQSLNEVIDLHSERVQAGTRNRIPGVIWIGLVGLSMLGMWSVGYQAGLSMTRRSPAMLALLIGFVFVTYLIADLDRGSEGLLRVGQAAMTDLQKSLDRSPPVSPRPTGN